MGWMTTRRPKKQAAKSTVPVEQAAEQDGEASGISGLCLAETMHTPPCSAQLHTAKLCFTCCEEAILEGRVHRHRKHSMAT
jgi:hypothetical protein